MEQQRGQSETVATPIPFTGYVLAGGKSTRMGRDKALLEIGGKPLIRSAVNLLKTLTDQVVILGPEEHYDFLGVPVFPDLVPSRGPLSAIYTGLERSGTAVNLFLACDMPLMVGTFLKLLLERAPLADAVLLRLDDGSLEPLCAVYNRSCLPTVQANYERQRFKLSDLFPELRTHYLTEGDLRDSGLDRRIFTNLNDSGDLERWGLFSRLSGESR
ncbi:MAG: molybdenum cofactor guanylyltransferase [Acidobacteriota bacterium]|nr:molybdenum cofactor guanylyltransferase [Acidobacteriota bacterium]